MRWSGLRLSVTLLTVIPLRDPVREPRRATAAAAMAWAPAVGVLLGVGGHLTAGKLVAFLHPKSTRGVLTEFCAVKPGASAAH